MEYNIKFIQAGRLLGIGIVGNIISIIVPIYLKNSSIINVNQVGGLFLSGFVFSWVLAYFTSKRSDYYHINNEGLLTKKFGLVKWKDIKSLKLVDYSESEIYTIRFHGNRKITIPSKINNSTNRKTFVAFINEIEKRVSQERGSIKEITQYAYAYEGKGIRIMGYVTILMLLIITPYVVYCWITGKMEAKKIGALATIYGSALPFLYNIFRKRLFGRPDKRMPIR